MVNTAEHTDTVTVHIPMSFRRRGGRKVVIAPDGVAALVPPRAHVDNTMIKAIARAFRWRKLLETGAFCSVAELAAAEAINKSYVSRVLRLTLLAPEIVEAILDGRQPTEMTLAALMGPFPVEWQRQKATFTPQGGRSCRNHSNPAQEFAWRADDRNFPTPTSRHRRESGPLEATCRAE